MAIAAYVAQALSRLEPKEVVTRNQFSRYIESRGDPALFLLLCVPAESEIAGISYRHSP
jgi:hypothetical protein